MKPLLLLLLFLVHRVNGVTQSCCTLSTSQLTATPSCSVGTSIFSSEKRLTQKCDTCPPGTCRVNDLCFCGADFAVSKPQQALCEYTFKTAWPFTIGETDPAIRSCTARFEGEETTTDSCCSLSEDKLRAIAGWYDICPRFDTSLFSNAKRLGKKCDPCPTGTCRLNKACVCPLDFLNSDGQKEACRASFTRSWPESVGLEDRHFRACVREVKMDREAFTFDNCCSLPREQHLLRVGTALDCPFLSDSLFSDLQSAENCGACPVGSCRIGESCYCPHDFIEGTRLQEACREDFGSAYPVSVGRPDKRCPNNPEPEMLGPPPPGKSDRGDGKDSPTDSSPPSRGPGSANSDAFGIKPTATSGTSTSASSGASTSASTNRGGGDHLSVAEIIGIVTGIISAVGVVVTWFAFCRRRKSSDDSTSSEQPLDELL